MKISSALLLLAVLVSGCKITPIVGNFNQYTRDYKAIPTGSGSYKALAFVGNENDAWVANYWYDGDNLAYIIRQALKDCNESKPGSYQIYGKCKIRYLGNSEIKYKHEEEFEKLKAQYLITPQSTDLAYDMENSPL